MSAESLATETSSGRYRHRGRSQTKPFRSGRASIGLIVMGAVSLAVTAALYATVFLPLKDTEFGALFVKRGRIPYVVVWLTAWSICSLIVKALQTHRQKKYFRADLLPSTLSEKITRENAGQFSAHIRGLSGRTSHYLLPKRLVTALEHFKSRGDVKEIVDLLESQSNIDAGALESSYALIKVFIWAIPILGFIGTVVGISQAVQGFSESIGAAQELNVIQDGLGIVTQGLAKAFDTTLVALAMSMLVMFPANWLQKEEEDLLGNVDAYCSENLLRRLDDEPVEPEAIKQAIAEAFDEHKSELELWMAYLREVGTHLKEQVVSGWTDVNAHIQQAQRQNLQETKGLFDAVAERQRALTAQLEESQTTQIQLCSNLVTAMGQTAANVQQEIASMQECQVRNAQDVVAILKGDIQTLQQDARQTYESLTANLMAATTQSLDVLRDAAGQVQSGQAAAVSSLRDAGHSMDEHMERLVHIVDEAVKSQLGSLTDMQEMTQSSSSEFAATMESVQSTHAQAMADAERLFRSALRALLAQLTERESGQVEHLKQISESMTEEIRITRQDFLAAKKTHLATVDAAQKQLASVGSSVDHRAAEQVVHLSTAVEKILTALGSKIEQVFKDERQKMAQETTEHLTSVSRTGNALVSSLVQSQQKLDEHIIALTRIADGHRELNALQGTLASNLEVLSASDSFKQTLSQINKNLRHLTVVLDSVGQKAGLLWPEGTRENVHEASFSRRLLRRLTGGNNDA